MSSLLHWRVLTAVVVVTIVCLVVSGPTKDKGGLEGGVSWVTFIGFWAGLVATLVLGAALFARLIGRRATR